MTKCLNEVQKRLQIFSMTPTMLKRIMYLEKRLERNKPKGNNNNNEQQQYFSSSIRNYYLYPLLSLFKKKRLKSFSSGHVL